MTIGREGGHDSDRLRCESIGRVHDAERRLTALDQRQLQPARFPQRASWGSTDFHQP